MRRLTRRDEGVSTVYVAVMLVALFGFVAFAVDTASLYEERREREIPLRFALVWAKFVTAMLGTGGFSLAAAMMQDRIRKKKAYDESSACAA